MAFPGCIILDATTKAVPVVLMEKNAVGTDIFVVFLGDVVLHKQ